MTSVLFQPAAFAAGATDAVITGAVRSTLSVTDAVAVLPALSVAVPRTIWFAPSDDTTCGGGHDAMPDRSSAQTKVTVAFWPTHPAAFGGGATVAAIVGAVLSMLSVTLAVAVLPALSVAVPDTICPWPSVLTTRDGGHDAMPDPESLHVKATCTSVRFQPAPLGTGDAAAVMVGGTVSVGPLPVIRTDMWEPGLLLSSMRSVLVPDVLRFTVRSMTPFQS